LHSKLMDQKKNKKQLQKEKNQIRLRELNKLGIKSNCCGERKFKHKYL
jgi:hypothetical protein